MIECLNGQRLKRILYNNSRPILSMEICGDKVQSSPGVERPNAAEAQADQIDEWGLLEAQSWNIFHYLWKKSIHGKSCPDISIPDTVIFQGNVAKHWFFTSKSGQVRCKDNKMYGCYIRNESN